MKIIKCKKSTLMLSLTLAFTPCVAQAQTIHINTVEQRSHSEGVVIPTLLSSEHVMLTWDNNESTGIYFIEDLNQSEQWIHVESADKKRVHYDESYKYFKSFRVPACTEGECLPSTQHFNTLSSTSTYQYQYDALGRLVCVTRSNNTATQYNYDNAGNRQSVTNTCN